MFPSPKPSFNFSTRLWINLVAITWGVFGTEVNLLHSLEAGLDDIVHLQSRDHDVEAPEEDKDGRRDGLEELGSSELSANGRVSPHQQDEDGTHGLDTEDGHGEAQAGEGTVRVIETTAATTSSGLTTKTFFIQERMCKSISEQV